MKKIYGLIFKRLRVDKGFSLKEISDEFITSSSISKFENGHSKITVGKFFYLLKKISVSPQEFFTYLEEYQGAAFSVTLINLPFAFEQQNYVAVERMLTDFVKKSERYANSPHLKLQVLGIKGIIYQLNRDYYISGEDFKLAKHHLISTKQWNEFEIRLYSRLAFLFNDSDLKMLATRLLSPLNYPMFTIQVRESIYDSLVNLTFTLLERELYDYLVTIEAYIHSNPYPERYMLQKGIIDFNLAHARYCQNDDKEQSAKEMIQIMKAFETLDALGWVTRLKKSVAHLDIDGLEI